MGTSSIFTGKKDKHPLVPTDFDEQQEKKIPPVTWKTVKTDMSKYISSGGTYGTAKHIISQAIKANGGAHRMTQHSTAGIRAAINMGNFFAGIASKGISVTLQQLGVQYEGKSVHAIFSNLINAIAPTAESKEDIVARDATMMALGNIYDYVLENDLALSSLDQMPKELIDNAIKSFLSEYIWANIMKDLESRIEQYMDDTSSACDRENDLKEVIEAVVDVEYDKNGSIIKKEITETVSFLMERCLGMLEGIV